MDDSVSNKLSLREKSLLKRRINKEHNSNLRAGYVHVTEEHLRKTGLRGHKLDFVYVIIFLLVVAAFANITVTIYILKTLGIDNNGMKSLQFMAPGKLLSFAEETEISDVLLVENTISDYEECLELMGANRNTVSLEIAEEKGPKLSVSNDNIDITNVDDFMVIDPNTDKTMFSTQFKKFKFPSEVNSIKSKIVVTEKVSSPFNEDLGIITEDIGTIYLSGKRGVHFEGRTLSLSARSTLHILASKAGIYLKDVLNLATVPPTMINVPERLAITYKLCVCKSNGRLFKVPNYSRCDETSSIKEHPCLE